MQLTTLEVCPLCKRTPAQLWRRRLCGPLTGTAAGPMTDEERARYAAGWAAATVPDVNPDDPGTHVMRGRARVIVLDIRPRHSRVVRLSCRDMRRMGRPCAHPPRGCGWRSRRGGAKR